MDCIFCKIVAGDIPSKKIYEDDVSFAFLDLSPWQVGHALVVPKEHSVDAMESPEILAALAPAVVEVSRMAKERLGAAAINLLSNAGEIAGQSVFHTHVHIIPRYEDSPGLDAMKGVVSEGLDVTHSRYLGN